LTIVRRVLYAGVVTIRSHTPRGYNLGSVVPFLLLHLAILAVFVYPPSWYFAAWIATTYSIRMFGVTAGYHRYFSHRSYRMSRVPQFLMAFLAQTSGQKGVLWWAAQHRQHHRHSDREDDVHSPARRGFWWSHAGWILSNDYDQYDPKSVADLARYPELRFLDRYHLLPTILFALAILWLGGWGAFVWGYVVSSIALYHCTFAINSLAHLFGSRRFDTADESRNNWMLALVTFGEGWHNNHHFSMASCRQGYRWWEIDLTYAVLKLLALIGVARDLRPFRMPGTRVQAIR
jgi:stearoyl-CoA desaturase (delta-9 desaturase)